MSRFLPKPVSAEVCQNVLARKKNWILTLCSPARVIVFGSAARNELTDHSDIDLALLFENSEDLNAAREVVFYRDPDDEWAQDLLLYLESDFERRKHLGGVCQLIFEEGICIYERNKSESSKTRKDFSS
jgi:predicted nucleotidyltransferase